MVWTYFSGHMQRTDCPAIWGEWIFPAILCEQTFSPYIVNTFLEPNFDGFPRYFEVGCSRHMYMVWADFPAICCEQIFPAICYEQICPPFFQIGFSRHILAVAFHAICWYDSRIFPALFWRYHFPAIFMYGFSPYRIVMGVLPYFPAIFFVAVPPVFGC